MFSHQCHILLVLLIIIIVLIVIGDNMGFSVLLSYQWSWVTLFPTYLTDGQSSTLVPSSLRR